MVIKKREDSHYFEEERNKCPNRVDKILYHGTQIEPISKILEGGFKKSFSKYLQHGSGIYFTDSLDYCWFFGGNKNNRANINKIPNIGETFTFIANSIYYNKEDFYRVIDYKHSPLENEINLAYTTGESKTIYGEPDKTKFYGTEYIIRELAQICPILGAKLKRNEYCVIWRDNFFSSKPVYNTIFDDLFKNYLSDRVEYFKQHSELNIYTCQTTEEALDLVEKKNITKLF